MFNKKLISLCLAAAMTASAVPTSVFAASIGSSSTDANIGEDTAQSAQTSYAEIFKNNNETQVYLTIDDKDRVVSLPTTVILSGTPDAQGKYIGKYSVGVSGDMSGKKIVKVEPEATASLTQRGKNNVTASIAQDQVSFNTDDFKNKTVTNGSISADSLTAGSWNSNFNFNVSTEVNGVPAGYTLLYKYDLSATKQDNVAAYYCVPNKNTEKIEDSPEENASVASISAEAQPKTDKVIEHNGVRYILSDKDKLVITGTGAMKENIAEELVDWEKMQQLIIENVSLTNWTQHYNIPKEKGFKIVTKNEFNPNSVWGKEIEPTKESSHSLKLKYLRYDFDDSKFREIPVSLRWTKANVYPSLSWGIGASYSPVEITYQKYSKWKDDWKNPDWYAQQVISGDMDATTTIGNAYYSYLIQYIKSIENDISITIPKEVIIEDGVTNISQNAFSGETRLEKITIANSVKSIDRSAFFGCTGLTNLDFLSSGIEEISTGAFSNCKFNNVTIPGNVKIIRSGAFSNTVIPNLTIDEGVETIENNAFNIVDTLHLAKSVKNYGKQSFLKIVRLYYNGTLDDYMNIKLIPTKSRTGELVYDYKNTSFPLSSVGSTLNPIRDGGGEVYFNNVKYDKNNFVIPSSITSIPNGIFANANINNIRFEGEVTNIGEYAFYNVVNFENNLTMPSYFYLPSTITNIGNNAFGQITQLYLYCESQTVADLLVAGTNYPDNGTITVDASKF